MTEKPSLGSWGDGETGEKADNLGFSTNHTLSCRGVTSWFFFPHTQESGIIVCLSYR